MVDGVDIALENMKEQVSTMKSKLSQLRKKGFDTKIAELKVLAIPSKIKFIELTHDFKEVSKANKMVADALLEVQIAETEGEKQKAEKEMNKQMDEVSALADAADDELKDKNQSKAKEYYTLAQEKYKKLPEDRKKEVLDRLSSIRSKLTNP